jgi:TonB family protein
MQQDGGVKRHALSSSLDAMATPFGAYDRAIVEAISQRWYDLLDSQQFADSRTGKVTVDFHLNPDGSVTELKISGNSVGDLLGYVCQNAIEEAAPFAKWPSDMRRMVGANFREITFTFYYY